MLIFIRNTTNNLWKLLLLSTLILNISCATEEVEETDATEVDAEMYGARKKLNLKNATFHPKFGVPYYIRNVNSVKVLDWKAFGKNGERNVHQYLCFGTNNQKWIGIRTREGYTRFQSVQDKNKFLEIQGGGKHNGANLVVGHNNNTRKQQFQLSRTTTNSRHFVIKNVNSNKIIDVKSRMKKNGANVHQYTRLYNNKNENQHWEFFPVSGSY